MIKALNIILVVAMLLLTGCGDNTIDTSSEESMQESIARVKESLPTEKHEAFEKALLTVALGGDNFLEIAATPGGPERRMKERLDGMTAEKVFAEAEKIRAEVAEREAQRKAETAVKESQREAREPSLDLSLLAIEESPEPDLEPEPETISLGQPVIIDGIEIIISDPRISGLEIDQEPDSIIRYKPNEGTYLVLSTKLHNTTVGNIVLVQDVWDDVRLVDNFGNVFRTANLPIGPDYVGYSPDVELRPGQVHETTMILEPPLSNSENFKLTIDPGFFRRHETSNHLIRPLSDSDFQIRFSVDDVSAWHSLP